MSLSDQLWCPTSAQVTVLQARGLRIKGKSGTNDAYAVMQVGKEKYQTSVAEKSVAPVWKEEATFDLPQGAGGGGGSTDRSTLHVHVLHRALVGPDKLLGQAVINLLQLSEDKTRNKSEWFKLLDKTGKADKDRGEVFVDIQFMRNNMTASMFDLSGAGKSRSRLGKFKDKVRGKKKESDTVSTIVQPFTQVLTDSEEEGNDDVEVAAGKDEKKKKKKIKSLFSTKSNLQRNMSQSMSVLPVKNSTLSGSQSSGLNVDSSEGKKKFKFMIHKRSGSSDSKDSSSVHQKHGAAEQSNLCINGSHVYCEEPQGRTSRIGSNFSLASSGHGSMEDVPESSPPSVDSLRAVRQYSPWTEEEEETAEVESIKEDVSELREEEERIRTEEENRRKEEEMVRRQEEEEAVRLAEEKRRLEEEQRRQREEEERAQEERRRQEEESKLAEEKRRLEEEERRRIEEEKIRKEEEERIQREEEERRRREEEERAKREEEECERLAEEKRRLQEQERRRIEEEEKRQREEEERIRMEEERVQEQRRRQEEEERARRQEEEERARRQEEEERARRQEEEHKLEEEKRRLEEERRRIEEENARKEEEERIRREEERRRQEEEEMVRRQKEEHEEMRRLEEQERRQREEEERIKKEEEETARREKEEYETLLEEKRKLEEEERKRLEAEEKIRKEEEARIRVEEERRRKEEEERVKREEEELKRLAEEKMKLEEQERRRIEEEERQREEMIRKEEERRKEEEERARKEKEEYERLVEEKMRQEEQERRRLEEEERIRKEEQERIRMEEEKRRREEEEKRIIEEEENMKKEEEERIRKEEEARKLEEVKRDAEEQKKRENQTQTKSAGMKSTVESRAEVTSTNPFDENFSSNPFDEIPNSPAANVSTVQQRSQSAVSLLEGKASADEKDLISTQREKRLAPQPPGKTQTERQSQREQDGNTRHLAQINKQSKDKDVKTVSVHPQRSVQMIAPLSRSPTDAKNTKSLTQSSTTKETTNVAKNSKRPAPSKPRSVEEGPSSKPKTALSSGGKISNERGSKTKQEPVVYGLNPFEDDEDENELTAKDDSKMNTSSVQRPPAVPQDADIDATSQAKIKSSKMAPAPPLPANKASTSSTLINQNTEGGHVKVDTSVTVPDNSVTQPCDLEHAQKTRAATAQSSVEKAGGKKEGPPVTSRRLQPVKPLNPLGQQSASVVRGETDNKSTEILGEVQEDLKVNNTELKGPYSQLTREELISLVLKQENQMTERDKKISQLEQYIDNLLVRVMEEKPSILMSMNSLK